VSPFVLSVLKYALLALLYFFIYRAVRSVAVEVSGRRSGGRTTEMKSSSPAPAAKASKGGKAPATVVVHEPESDKPRTVRLSERTDIGRADGCAIRLQDTYVSQVHARLAGKNGTWHVEDLGSTNGTYLNDRKVVAPVEVHAGDVVRVGKTVLELRR
jgi:pSer/pThr/pTyr-binding forkhead associated (FHA) protein